MFQYLHKKTSITMRKYNPSPVVKIKDDCGIYQKVRKELRKSIK